MVPCRQFVYTGGLAALGTTSGLSSTVFPNSLASYSPTFVSKRPPLSERKFVSDAVEQTILKIKKQISDPELAWANTIFGELIIKLIEEQKL